MCQIGSNILLFIFRDNIGLELFIKKGILLV